MIYTSYFGNMKNILKKFPNMVFISVAGKTPEWFLKINNCSKYSKLSPHYGWWVVWKEKFKDDLGSEMSKRFYREKYFNTVLNQLEIKYVKKELKNIGNKNDVCLLCYEKSGEFCHRNIIREWFNKSLIKCEELNNELNNT